jgi:prefoldin subunit 5
MAIVENFVMALRRDSANANITYTNTGGTFTPPFRFRVKFFQFDGVNPAQLLDTREVLLTQVISPSMPNTYSSASYFDGTSYPNGTSMMQGIYLDATNKQFGFSEATFPAGFSQTDVDNAVAAATNPLNAQIATLNTQIAQHTSTVTALNTQITTLTNHVATVTAQRDALQIALDTAQTLNAGQSTTITNLTAQIQSLNADIVALNQTITELQQTATIIGFVPNTRAGQYTIKDFTVLDGIHRRTNGANSGFYEKLDIDFINTQLLSLKQGANKMRKIAASQDANFTLQFRPRSAREDEYTARRSQSFTDYLLESARILDFAINEVRNNQKFNLDNIRFHRTI